MNASWLWAGWGALLGTGWQLQQSQLWSVGNYSWLMGCSIVCLGLALFGTRTSWANVVVLLAASGLLAGFTGWRAIGVQSSSLSPDLEGVVIELVGDVIDLPHRTPHGVQFELETVSAHVGERVVMVPERIQLGWMAADSEVALPQLRVGQRWRLPVRLRRPHGVANPHGFDTELWFWQQRVGATGQVQLRLPVTAPVLLPSVARMPVATARQRVRDAIFQRVSDPRSAGVLAALVVGDQASIDGGDWGVFRATGVAHLISISGLHVTMFAALAALLVGHLLRGLARWWPALLYRIPVPVAATWGGIFLAAGYAVFAGWGLPAQRTVLMLALVGVLRLSGCRWPWPVVWLSTMITVVLFDPWALLQPGFWLSFVAVGVLFSSTASADLEPQGWWGHVRELARTQAVVTVALTPLTLLLFGQFSLVGLIANLGAIPWVTLVVTPLAMAGVVLPWLWELGAWSVQLMGWVLQVMAAWPWAAVERPTLPLVLASLAVIGGVLVVWRGPLLLRAWGVCLLWPALVYAPQRPNMGHFELVAADVGQGSAVVVRTASHTLLHDTGPLIGRSSAAERILLPMLRAHGDRLDGLVVSHSDSDHAGGLAVLAHRYPDTELWTSFDTLGWVQRSVTRCVAGQSWVWDGVRFDVLSPQQADYTADRSSNALSCVLRVTSVTGQVVLLPGDITQREETTLLQRYPELRVDVLLAGHHGSHTSSSEVWLDALRPRHIIIQSGYRNRYHHPSPEVLDRYDARGIAWVNSPECGSASWSSRDPDTISCYRILHPRYWHGQLNKILTDNKERSLD